MNYRPVEVDAVVVTEEPKPVSHMEAMHAAVADVLGLPVGPARVKAKTAEGLDEVGEGREKREKRGEAGQRGRSGSS